MFDALIVAYLFLGGAGAGALVVLSFLELASSVVQARSDSHLSWAGEFPQKFYRICWPLCLGILLFAILSLSFDLGRLDRLFHLVTAPSFSALTVGAYSLVGAALCTLFFFVVRVFDSLDPSVYLVRVIAVIGIFVGCTTALYTGILLASLASVLFWQTPLLPLLFFLSSLSTGIACLFLGISFVEARSPFARTVVYLARIDAVLIVLEVVCLAAYLLLASANTDTATTVSAFFGGELTLLFWGGLVGCGLILPFTLEWFVSARNYRMQVLWIALFVLIGGLVLRICIVEAAAFDVTQTPQLLYSFGNTSIDSLVS